MKYLERLKRKKQHHLEVTIQTAVSLPPSLSQTVAGKKVEVYLRMT